MEDIFIGKQNRKVATKVTAKAKDLIVKICAARELSESDYLRLAIKNQIRLDEQAETLKPRKL
jgi:hypothetical protein